MRLPRDLSGKDLAKALKPFGYEIVRQTGSHMQLRTTQRGEHSITIPQHNFIRVGTLSQILSNIAQHLGISREELTDRLFGQS